MLGSVLDVFRLRQYFNAITRVREWAEGLQEDAGFLDDFRRAVVRLPFEKPPGPAADPFPPFERTDAGDLAGKRVALMATGGSGALASVVGVARAFEEAGIQPSTISLCSGSALFGFPLAAGLSTSGVTDFLLALDPVDYVDPDFRRLLASVPAAGRGFAGLLAGERLEAQYRSLLGELRLGDLEIPAYAPIWNIEENRLEFLGPSTYPDVTVARAVRMAVALPLFIAPVEFAGGWWCDGGIVDIFPVTPVLEIEPACDVAVVVNGFYPPEFVGEDATGWHERAASILHVASQVRTCQQVELARQHLDRLRGSTEVVMLEPVPYETVRGVGFYRQFLSTRDWPDFMRSGRDSARDAFARRSAATRTGR